MPFAAPHRPPTGLALPLTLLLAACLGAAMFGPARFASAQAGNGAPAAGAEEAATTSPAPPERSPLDLVYLRNAEGELVPVLRGLSWEEFERIRDEAAAGPERPEVAFTHNALRITGNLREDRAELNMELEITNHAREGEWVRIPLDLRPGVFLTPPKLERGFLTLDSTAGYTLWLPGASKDTSAEAPKTKVTLPLAVPVVRRGERSELRLTCPNATYSDAKLSLELPNAVVQTATDRNLKVIHRGNLTQVELLGIGGQLNLTWQAAAEGTAALPAVLEAAGETLFTFEDDAAMCETRLRVRSRRGEFDSFRVRLPEGFRYLPRAAEEYTVIPIVAPDESQTPREQVEIRLLQPTKGLIEIRLIASADWDSTTPAETPWKLSPPDVPGAARQWGYLACAMERTGVLKFQFEEPIRRTMELPESLQRSSVTAGFEYTRLPCTLNATLVERESQLIVQPIHILRIEPGRVSLDSRCRYSNQGAKPYFLEADFAGWQLLGVGPAELVKENVDLSDPQMLVVPLKMPPEADFELRVQGRLEIPADSSSAILPIPEFPMGSARAPLLVFLGGADLEPVLPAGDLSGLVPAVLPEDLRELLGPTAQAYSYLRNERSGGVEVHIRRRSDQVEIDSLLAVDSQKIGVQQRFRFEFTREVRTVSWLLEGEEIADLRVTLAGKLLTPRWPAAAAGSDPRMFSIDLPAPVLGRCELVLDYEYPVTLAAGEHAASLAVPLAMPTEEIAPVVLANRAVVQGEEMLKVDVEGGQWRSEMEAEADPLAVFTVDRVSRLPLRLELPQVDSRRLSIVQQCWLQTFLTPRERQDRAVMRLTTGEPSFVVRIPETAEVDTLDVLVDGRPAAATLLPDSQLRIELGGEASSRPLLVEIWCRSAPEQDGWRRTLAPIEPVSAASTRQAFWHVAMPRDELLLFSATSATREDRWVWSWPAWGFRPKLSQADVESWISPESSFQLPEGMNLHLFSSVDTPRELRFVTAGRRWVWIVAGLAILLPGLLVVYVPALRRPPVLLVLGLALAATACFYPEPALIAGPFALVGGLALATARTVQWGLERRREGVVRGASRSSAASRSTPRGQPLPEGNRDTTATAAGNLPLSGVGSHSG